jgi:two-component system phosphate regulon sensor histidine kinase PhoR
MHQPDLPSAHAREDVVWNLLRFVDDFGRASEGFFKRLYQGLRRKPVQRSPEPDQESALRQANRELSMRLHHLQTLAARLEAIFARLEEGVIMQSPEGRVVLINDAAMRLIGSMRLFWESDLGRLFKQAHDLPDATAELEPIGKPLRVQINNRILGVRLSAVRAQDGSALGTLLLLTDATRETLADRLKDQFVTQLTHELRTPLTAIKGMSEVLLSAPSDRPPNRKFLEAIGRNVNTLDRMITELLDISEMSAGSFAVRRQPLWLDELVFDVIKGREAAIKRSGLTIGMAVVNRDHLRVLGDDRRLSWALGHLIDNAINYTLKGGSIMVRLGALRGDKVLIDVVDSGVGISERDAAHIFERFYRGEARAPDGKLIDPRGLGQGLYIARAVAEAHGGYLVFTSTLGQGSKFTLGLPLAPAESAH